MTHPTRPEYVLTLRPEPGVDGTQALRGSLKVLLRRFGLRCVRATVADPSQQDKRGGQDVGCSTIEVTP